MSASAICPLCKGSGFRSPDNDNNYIICECIDLNDDDEDCGFGQCEKCGLYHVDDFGCYRCRHNAKDAE